MILTCCFAKCQLHAGVSFFGFFLQDSYESMDLKELLSADFSEIITAMNNSESHILQRLRQVQ